MELFKSRPRVVYTNAVGDKVYPVVVDIKKGIKSTEDIQFVSSDVNTGILSVAFISGNDNFNVTGADVVCSVMRPDASTLELPCEVVGENIVEVPLGINGTSQDGVYSFDFKVLKGGNKVVGTPIMNYSVSLSIGNDMVVEEDDRLPVLTMLMTQLTELKDEARESITQANTATVASREATAKAIEATNNANAVSERVSQETNEVITRVDNKVNEVETRFNSLTTSQQQDAEVIDARDGEVSLKARLDRDIEKAKQVYVELEGNHISTESSTGAIQDIQILGNTVQDPDNLSDIKSVGELQEDGTYKMSILSCGKNLLKNITNIKQNSDLQGLNVSLNDNNNLKINGTTTGTAWIVLNIEPVVFKKGITYYANSTITDTIYFEANVDNAYVMLSDSYTPSEDKKCNEIRFRIPQGKTLNTEIGITIHTGTQATPYEPYQENKCDILLPCQLEKVGNVSDRIICKDGVWGVEKNIKTKNINTNIFNKRDLNNENYARWCKPNSGEFMDCVFNSQINGYCDKYEVVTDLDSRRVEKLSVCLLGGTDDYRIMLVTPSEIDNVEKLNDYVSSNPFLVKYPTTQPTFIPLPLDVQIQLNSFFGTTHVYMESGEVEGTIKCKIPKSLGATVQSLNNKTDILSDRIEAIEGLKDSQNMKYETDKGYLVCKETKNGVIDDLKLEGKTLVNLWDINKMRKASSISVNDNYVTVNADGSWIDCHPVYTAGKVPMLKPNTEYTVITHIKTNTLNGAFYVNIDSANRSPYTSYYSLDIGFTGYHIHKLRTKTDLSGADTTLRCQVGDSCTTGQIIFNCIVLEGDHTQNPPSYFEGLMSVGQDVDEIEVLSRKEDGNLFDESLLSKYITPTDANEYTLDYTTMYTDNFIHPVNGDGQYTFSYTCKETVGNKNPRFMFNYDDGSFENINPATSNSFTRYSITSNANKKLVGIKVTFSSSGGNWIIQKDSIILNKGTTPKPYTPYQSDKKQILFYNSNGELEPIQELHEWDSIEKHSDNKWYYHKRSGKVVLNGSEFWQEGLSSQFTDTHMYFACNSFDSIMKDSSLISDKFENKPTWDILSRECIDSVTSMNKLRIRLAKSKLTTQDVAGFKQWLQENNVTVVYQLAQEEVYELAPLHLDSYANETLILCNSGAISPKMEFSITSHINELIKSQGDRISLLEEKMYKALKQVLAGDMYSLAELLYPEDFVEENPENEIMLLPFE